jgi:hypothetical protein
VHITTGLGEPLGDQAQRLARDPQPRRDHLFRVDLTHRGVQRQQHPRTHDHRSRMHARSGQPDQLVTIRLGQHDRPLLL